MTKEETIKQLQEDLAGLERMAKIAKERLAFIRKDIRDTKRELQELLIE